MRFYSEQTIDFSNEYLDINQFILQEFFNSDEYTWSKICSYYSEIHGNRALSYLARKFQEWKNGDYHLTELMESRILETMPKFLTDEAIQKLCTNDFLSTIKRTIKRHEYDQKLRKYEIKELDTTQDLVDIFRKEVEIINDLKLEDVRFNLLSENEKKEALLICKYILKLKLQTLYNQLKNDLKSIVPFLGRITRGKILIDYKMNSVNASINFKNTKLTDIIFPKFDIADVRANSRFDSYANKYLAYEIVEIHKKSTISLSDGFLNKIDLEIFFTKYEDLIYGENEIKMKSLFRGEAGELTINASIIPLKLLKVAMYESIYKILITIIVIVGIISWLIKNENIVLLLAFWFITIPAVIFTTSFLTKQIHNLSQFKKEIATYG